MSAPHTDVLNFDLLIYKYENGYRAYVVDSPSGQAKHDFILPFNPNELKTLFALPNHYYRYLRLAPESEPEPKLINPQRFGTRLFQAVFAEEIRTRLLLSIHEVRRQNSRLCIRLRLSEVPELAILPWEYLFNPVRAEFLALSDDVSLVRYMDLPEAKQSLNVTLPLRVLCMISDPGNAAHLAVEQEWMKLQEALRDLVTVGKLMLERLPAATSASLRQQLRMGEYHVFHFIGHGWFDEQDETSGLIFEDEQGYSAPINAQQLGVILAGHRPLRLAFLNACEGAKALSHTAFSGTAQHLVRQNLPAIIAMQFPITDKNAVCLSHEFYYALADNCPVDRALTEARKAIYVEDGNSTEWATPVLFMRAENGQLFNTLQAEALNTFGDVITAIRGGNYTKAEVLISQRTGADASYFKAISMLRGRYPSEMTVSQAQEVRDLVRNACFKDNSQAHYYYLYAWILYDYSSHHKRIFLKKDDSAETLVAKANTLTYKSNEMKVLYDLVPHIKKWIEDRRHSNDL